MRYANKRSFQREVGGEDPVECDGVKGGGCDREVGVGVTEKWGVWAGGCDRENGWV